MSSGSKRSWDGQYSGAKRPREDDHARDWREVHLKRPGPSRDRNAERERGRRDGGYIKSGSGDHRDRRRDDKDRQYSQRRERSGGRSRSRSASNGMKQDSEKEEGE